MPDLGVWTAIGISLGLVELCRTLPSPLLLAGSGAPGAYGKQVGTTPHDMILVGWKLLTVPRPKVVGYREDDSRLEG